jgi:aspartyl-tRNA(Asn)/glutamyl-tRNA(Gln) amidotransferase subunit C
MRIGCFTSRNFGIISVLLRGKIPGGERSIMSRITLDQVKHVANLARLAVTEEEAEKFTKQLDDIITFAELLNELDTENVEPTSHVLPMKNVLREDEAKPGLPVEEVLKNAPDSKDGQIRVPSIIE